MKSRVTITLDPDVRRHAKVVARRRGTTVSGLIEALLSAQTQAKESHVEAMLGIGREAAHPAPGTDPRYDYLAAKYLKPAVDEDRQLYDQVKAKTRAEGRRENSD